MTWAEIASDFEWDGSLRDLYVMNATVEDWQRVLDALSEIKPTPVMHVDGEAIKHPLSAEIIFQRRQNSDLSLYVRIGNIRFNCHFFQDDEIEFDLDPREVKRAADLDSIKAFMRLLAERTGKTAILTHENSRSALILTVSP